MSALFTTPFNWPQMIDDLAEKGLYVNTQFLPKELSPTFDLWYGEIKNQDLFKPAKIGKSQQANLNSQIRSDSIYWIDHFPSQLQELSDFLAEFQRQINSQLFLSLKRYELHLSCYHSGSFYKTHIDRSQHNQNRILTFILYLNRGWTESDGGQLVIYSPQNEQDTILKITPEFGTLVIFRSELYPHEVLTAHKERKALTGWFRND